MSMTMNSSASARLPAYQHKVPRTAMLSIGRSETLCFALLALCSLGVEAQMCDPDKEIRLLGACTFNQVIQYPSEIRKGRLDESFLSGTAYLKTPYERAMEKKKKFHSMPKFDAKVDNLVFKTSAQVDDETQVPKIAQKPLPKVGDFVELNLASEDQEPFSEFEPAKVTKLDGSEFEVDTNWKATEPLLSRPDDMFEQDGDSAEWRAKPAAKSGTTGKAVTTMTVTKKVHHEISTVLKMLKDTTKDTRKSAAKKLERVLKLLGNRALDTSGSMTEETRKSATNQLKSVQQLLEIGAAEGGKKKLL